MNIIMTGKIRPNVEAYAAEQLAVRVRALAANLSSWAAHLTATAQSIETAHTTPQRSANPYASGVQRALDRGLASVMRDVTSIAYQAAEVEAYRAKRLTEERALPAQSDDADEPDRDALGGQVWDELGDQTKGSLGNQIRGTEGPATDPDYEDMVKLAVIAGWSTPPDSADRSVVLTAYQAAVRRGASAHHLEPEIRGLMRRIAARYGYWASGSTGKAWPDCAR